MKCQNYSNVQLLRILENPEEHTSMEVYLAREEFSSRNISDEELDELKEQLEILKQKEKASSESKKETNFESNEESDSALNKKQFFNTKKKAAFIRWVDGINPFNPNKQKIEKYLAQIYCGVLIGTICYLISFACEFKSLFYAFYSSSFIFSVIIFIFLFIVFLSVYSAHLFFYKRRKAGWLLLFLILTISAVSRLFIVLIILLSAAIFSRFIGALIFHAPFFVIYELIILALSVYLLILLFKNKVRKIFNITSGLYYIIATPVLFIIATYLIVVLIKMIMNY